MATIKDRLLFYTYTIEDKMETLLLHDRDLKQFQTYIVKVVKEIQENYNLIYVVQIVLRLNISPFDLIRNESFHYIFCMYLDFFKRCIRMQIVFVETDVFWNTILNLLVDCHCKMDKYIKKEKIKEM